MDDSSFLVHAGAVCPPRASLPLPDLSCPLEDMVDGQWVCGCLQAAAGWTLAGVWKDKEGTHQQRKMSVPQAGTSSRTSTRKRVSGKMITLDMGLDAARQW